MKINKRLQAVATLVDCNSNIIDVGCDHALLDIYLIEKNINIKAIASDNKEGPIKRALLNVKEHKLENVIKVKLGEGLEPIEEDTDTIIISGMGGKSMNRILKNGRKYLSQIKTIILSPNNDVELIRKFVLRQGFSLENELMVEEKNILYPILKFKKGKVHYSRKEYIYGPVYLKEMSPLFIKYLRKEIDRKKSSLTRLPKKYFLRRFVLQKQINKINKIINNKED